MLSMQRALLRQSLAVRSVAPWRDTWLGKVQPRLNWVGGLRPFHHTIVMFAPSRGANEEPLPSDDDYKGLMDEIFSFEEKLPARKSAKLNAALLGEPYGSLPKKKTKAPVSLEVKPLQKKIPKVAASKEKKEKLVWSTDNVKTGARSSALKNKGANMMENKKIFSTYINGLLHELPLIDMAVPEPARNKKDPLIIDVDTPADLMELESVDALPALQPTLDNYAEFMAQYRYAVREALLFEVRTRVSKETEFNLEGSFKNCTVNKGTSKKLATLTVPVSVAGFGRSPEQFTNELLLLRSSVSYSASNPEVSEKLIFGRGNLKMPTETSDGLGLLTIELLPKALKQLIGDFASDGNVEKLPLDIHWSHLAGLTSYFRKMVACCEGTKYKPDFWEQICKGTLDPWPEAPENPIQFANLNAKQNDVVNRLVNSNQPRINYLVGPPGTGKTTTLVEAVKELANKFPTSRILVVAPSNRAMQVDVERFLASAPEESLPFATIASIEDKLPDNVSHLHEKNIVTHMLAPLRELAADVDSDLSTLVKKFKTAKALTQARLNRVLHSPVGEKVPKPMLRDVDALGEEKEFESEKDLRRHISLHLRAIEDGFSYLEPDFLLSKAQVFFATCISSGNSNRNYFDFDIVVLDEASQCDLPEAMIPIERYQPKLWLQIGDPKQLGPHAPVYDIQKKGYANSMLERATDGSKFDEVYMLTEQYRMHPTIRKWPSDLYYGGKLVENESVLTRSSPLALLPAKVALSGLPSAFLDVVGKESKGRGSHEAVEPSAEDLAEGGGRSFRNIFEAHAIADTVRFLLSHGVPPESIAVISFYSAQVTTIKNQLNGLPVFVNTVDGCQGDEYDFVLLSCVRSEFNVGFLNDSRRINVAMTRAKHACWVFGNAETLGSSNSDFADYLDYIGTPSRNNTSPPTALLRWKDVEKTIKADKGTTKEATKSAKKEKKASKKKVTVESAAAAVEKVKEVPVVENTKAGVKAKAVPAPAVVPQAFTIPLQPPPTDTSTSTWLTERMKKLGYSNKITQDCHEKLVEEQGFVQESFFAELSEAEFNESYLQEIGITSKGTKVYLNRLYKELRERYFPQYPPQVVASVPAPVIATATKAVPQQEKMSGKGVTTSVAEAALPARQTIKQMFAAAAEGEKSPKKSAKSVSAAEMAYSDRRTIEQVFAEVQAEHARLQAEHADDADVTDSAEESSDSGNETDGVSTEDTGDEASPSEESSADDFSGEESADSNDDNDDSDDEEGEEYSDSEESASAAEERKAKRAEKRLEQEAARQRAAANEAKKKKRETQRLGVPAGKANGAPLW